MQRHELRSPTMMKRFKIRRQVVSSVFVTDGSRMIECVRRDTHRYGSTSSSIMSETTARIITRAEAPSWFAVPPSHPSVVRHRHSRSVAVTALGASTEVTLRRARSVLGWVTIFGVQTTSDVMNLLILQDTQANSASCPQRDGK